MDSDIEYTKKLLKEKKITLEDKAKLKIDKGHGTDPDKVMKHLINPEALIGAELQPSRNPNDKTFRLVFEESSNKKIVIVIREREAEKDIFAVTGFTSSKKLDKLIRKHKTGRR